MSYLPPISRTQLEEALRTILGRRSAESKASVFNAAVTAAANILSTSLSPTYTPCIFRIYAAFDAAGVLTLRRTSGGATVSEELNSGTVLTADAAHMFDVTVDSGETVNLQYSVNATCLKLSVMEISGGV